MTSVSLPISHTVFSTWKRSPARLSVPAVVSCSIVAVTTAPSSQDHYRTKYFSPFHPRESLLDRIESDPLADETVQVEPSRLPQVDEEREVPRGQAVAVPRRLQRAAVAEDLDERQLDRHRRIRYADEHDGPGEVTGVERLAVCLRSPDCLDDHIRSEATSE